MAYKHMKIFVSILKVVLSLWSITGAVYMVGRYSDLASPWALDTLPVMFWLVLGIIQIVLALALIGSLLNGRLRSVSSMVAIALAVITLAGAVLYSAYAGFPGILWALVPAVLYFFIAYKNK